MSRVGSSVSVNTGTNDPREKDPKNSSPKGPELKLIKMSNIQPKPAEWLWYPYIPIGATSLIQGDGGLGKTSISLAIAAAVTRGETLPGMLCGAAQWSIDGDTVRRAIDGESVFAGKETLGGAADGFISFPAPVIIQNAEDSYGETIRPRLDQLGADNDLIEVIDEDEESLTFMDARIEQAIIRTGARLIILDPTQAYFGRANMNSAGSVRPIMKHLGKMAERNRCAVLLVGHLGKQGNKAAYRGLGSVDIFAAARSVLTVGRVEVVDTGEKGNTGMAGERGSAGIAGETISVMAHNKSNLAPHGPSLSFEIDPVRGFRWIGECDVAVKEVFQGEKAAAGMVGDIAIGMGNGVSKTESQFEKARCIIQNALDSGIREAADFEKLAEQHNISLKTFHRAKSALGIRSVKRGDTWHWELPIEGEYAEIFDDGQGGQGYQDVNGSARDNILLDQRTNNVSSAQNATQQPCNTSNPQKFNAQNQDAIPTNDGQCTALSTLSTLTDSENATKSSEAVAN